MDHAVGFLVNANAACSDSPVNSISRRNPGNPVTLGINRPRPRGGVLYGRFWPLAASQNR